jgi:para-nitrobenzyl esterase
MTSRPSFRSPAASLKLLFRLVALLSLVALLAACSSSSTPAVVTADSTTMCQATISQGALNGKLTGTTCEYLGVPYGAPPTGALRFMPPQPAAGWSTPRDAKTFGASCLQASNVLGAGSTASSEDCLSVNVFTPQAAASQPLPVMVFIYGGAFTSGSSSLYDGQPLSEKGPVVVVTMNYRLGALGFLALPQLDSQRSGAPSGSDGIRDQQLALKWVKDNVAIFHGDPNNVTVFGESAGSISTCIHVVSPGSQGLANRYIMESGSCVGQNPLVATQAQSYKIGGELAGAFCAGDAGTTGGADVLACLRAADPMALMTWVPPAGDPQTGINALLGNLLGPPFSPTIEGPGGVLPDVPANLIAAGKFDKNATVLAGTNKNEWGLFVDLATNILFGGTASSPLNITTSAQLNQGIVQVFGAADAPKVEMEYPSTDATAPQVFIDIVTDYAFRCPTRLLAKDLMAQGTKNYYLYSYELGDAWHSFELEPLFNVVDLVALGATVPSPGYTQEMLGYWTQFAATGNPNGTGNATAPMWPGYSPDASQYMQLLDPTPAANTNLRSEQCDFWDSFTPTIPALGAN